MIGLECVGRRRPPKGGLMTTGESARHDLLDRLAEEFAERWRRGERPALGEYVERYPDLADDIADLFPAMVEIERAEGDRLAGAPPASQAEPPPLERLGDFRILGEIGRGG